MVILGPQGGWGGKRLGVVKPRVVLAEDDEDDAGDSDLWIADIGEGGVELPIGRAMLTRDFRPDAPDAFLDQEEASGELIEV